jgi:hypothetical protein
MAQHRTDNVGDVLRSLAFAENHFGVALAQRAMVIDLREAKILERKMFQLLYGLFRRDFSRRDRLQQLVQIALVHEFVANSIARERDESSR